MSEQNIEKEQLYKGVFRAGKKDGTVYYRASLTKNGKHISLGSFPDALQAHRAYAHHRSQHLGEERATTVAQKHIEPDYHAECTQ